MTTKATIKSMIEALLANDKATASAKFSEIFAAKASKINAPVTEAVKAVTYKVRVPAELAGAGKAHFEDLASEFTEEYVPFSKEATDGLLLSKNGEHFEVEMPSHKTQDNEFSKKLNKEFGDFAIDWTNRLGRDIAKKAASKVVEFAKIHKVRGITLGSALDVFEFAGGQDTSATLEFMEEWCGYNPDATSYQENRVFWSDMGVSKEDYVVLLASMDYMN